MLIAAFVLAAIAGPILGVRSLDAATDAQVRISRVRELLDALVRIQLAEETGLRGYVATGDRYFLDSDGPPNPQFDRAVSDLRLVMEHVAPLSALQLVDAVQATHREWEQQVASPLLANPHRSDTLSKQTFGKLLTDRMRDDAQQLRTAMASESRRIESSLRFRINATVAASAVLVAAFALGALSLGVSRALAEQRLEREHELTDALQRTLRIGGVRLPRTQLGFAYASATEEAMIGGDLLDAWRHGDDGGWVLIADVSGKGIDAARHAAFVQYAIRALTAQADEPAEVVGRFNRLFVDTFADPSAFVVLFLGRIRLGQFTLSYASAGHSAGFIRRGNTVRRLGPTGPIIGMERESPYASAEVDIVPGETLVLATDGLTESRDTAGVFLGDDGVATLIARAPLDPQGICDLLVSEVEARSPGGIADDLAILAIALLHAEREDEPTFSTMEAAPGG